MLFNCNKVTHGMIRTADLKCRKRPLDQQSHNHGILSAVAVVGKELFGRRELVGGLDKGQFDRMNFDTIMNSYELLFRVATGEAWSSLMHKFMLVKYDSVLIENEPKIVKETNTAPAFFFFVPFSFCLPASFCARGGPGHGGRW